MATWIGLYIQSSELDSIIGELLKLSNSERIDSSKFPNDLGKAIVTDSKPSYLVVGQTQDDWITVRHNSFDKLKDWGELLSTKFQTKVLVTIAQSVSSGYYFALYSNGSQLREIEACYSEDFETINKGLPFDFENEEPGEQIERNGNVSYYFDFDSIEEYCEHLGLVLQMDYEQFAWTILKQKVVTKEIVKKPKWKFW